jgi:hypothetical protein
MIETKKPGDTGEKPLSDVSVMVSASMPDEFKGSMQAQDSLSALILLAGKIITAGGRIVFGGHPTITPVIRQAANLAESDAGYVQLYQLERFRDKAPEDIRDKRVFGDIHWFGTPDGSGDIDLELGEMRDAMCEASDAAVFIGGKTSGSVGKKLGIRDEYERFLKRRPTGPVYLLGFMECVTANIISDVASGKLQEPNKLS